MGCADVSGTFGNQRTGLEEISAIQLGLDEIY